MKRFGIAAAVTIMAVAAGNSSVNGQEPRGQSGDRTTAKSSTTAAQGAHTDAQGFVNDLGIAGLAEVQLGKMASERAGDADVKAFGQMMVKDHSKAGDELKQVASQMQLQVPTQLDQKHKDLSDKLSKLNGAEFDREYMNAMVMGHQEVLGKLRARTESALPPAGGAAGNRTGGGAGEPEKGLPSTTSNSNKPLTQDPATAKAQAGRGATTSGGHGDALTQWAAKAMPTVQMHLDRAKELQQKLAR
jgi:putative membrane protein